MEDLDQKFYKTADYKQRLYDLRKLKNLQFDKKQKFSSILKIKFFNKC